MNWIWHFDHYTKEQAGRKARVGGRQATASSMAVALISFVSMQLIITSTFCFPPHSTRLLQPLNDGLYGPLQKQYGKAADTYMN